MSAARIQLGVGQNSQEAEGVRAACTPPRALPHALGPGDRPAQVLKPTQRGERHWD